jgi:uncharacterized SAM-binding protein YcdF (DUF218 family)
MFFFLSKVLHIFVQPFTWILVLALIAIISKKKRKLFIRLTLFSFLFFTNRLIIRIPGLLYEPNSSTLESAAPYDYGIVLGGYSSWDKKQHLLNFHSSADRLLYGLKLSRDGYLKQLILSGGSGSLSQPEHKEAWMIRDFLHDSDSSYLIIEAESRNTYESALKCAHILEKTPKHQRVLLITSAVHMPRARACFMKQGIKVDICPMDHIRSGQMAWYEAIIPNIETFADWNKYTHEWLGFIMYKLRGYA